MAQCLSFEKEKVTPKKSANSSCQINTPEPGSAYIIVCGPLGHERRDLGCELGQVEFAVAVIQVRVKRVQTGTRHRVLLPESDALQSRWARSGQVIALAVPDANGAAWIEIAPAK